MKILTNEQYNKLIQEIRNLKDENFILKSKALREYQRGFSDGSSDMYQFASHLIFPNSDERGLGEPETPINFPGFD